MTELKIRWVPELRNVGFGAFWRLGCRTQHICGVRCRTRQIWVEKCRARHIGGQKLKTQNSKLRSSEVQTYCAQILIENARFPPSGFDTTEISSNSNENMSFYERTYCARIPIENARFPPFGFDTAEISSNSNENMSFYEKTYISCGDRRLSVVARRSSLEGREAGSHYAYLTYLTYLTYSADFVSFD